MPEQSGKREQLFGFTLDEWVASGVQEREYFELLLEADTHPHERWLGPGTIDEHQWLRLARLDRAYATRALNVIGPVWERWATARRARIPELSDPDLQLDHRTWAEQYETALEDLQRLARDGPSGDGEPAA